MRKSIIALVIGVILIVLGTVVIWGAGHELRIGPMPAIFIGYVCDVTQLVTGIILTLAGTATVSASLTYLLIGKHGRRSEEDR